VSKKVERNYLEINSLDDLNESRSIPSDYNIELVMPVDFELNKFFYY